MNQNGIHAFLKYLIQYFIITADNVNAFVFGKGQFTSAQYKNERVHPVFNITANPAVHESVSVYVLIGRIKMNDYYSFMAVKNMPGYLKKVTILV